MEDLEKLAKEKMPSLLRQVMKPDSSFRIEIKFLK